MNYKIVVTNADAMVPQVMELSFNQFRELFPAAAKRPLPRPELLMRDTEREVFLTLFGPDIRLTVYQDGVVLYCEPGGATTVFVGDCGKIAFRFVTGKEYLDEAALGGIRWYFPIITSGSHRIENNQDCLAMKYEIFRFDDGTDGWRIVPHTPNFASEEFRQDDERKRKESLLCSLSSAKEKLTPRQKEIVTLKYSMKKTQVQIASFLSVNESTVSITHRRAIESMRKWMRV